jgi:3,4-dihydroxy-2-butanone 4-phosphate synthase
VPCASSGKHPPHANTTVPCHFPLPRRERSGDERFRKRPDVPSLSQDDFARENEGDLIIPAEVITTEKMAFLLRHSTGIACCALLDKRCQHLELPPMLVANGDPKGTAFTVSCDLSPSFGITTGVSASDRALTVRALADDSTVASHLNRPGHVFPLRYRPGGVLVRDGHTEAAVDLALWSGHRPASLLCEVSNEDGTMSRLADCARLAASHGLPIISVADLKRFRCEHECLVRATHVETSAGKRLIEFESIVTGSHCATARVYRCDKASGQATGVLVLWQGSLPRDGPRETGRRAIAPADAVAEEGLFFRPAAPDRRFGSRFGFEQAVQKALESRVGELIVVELQGSRPDEDGYGAASDYQLSTDEHPSAYQDRITPPSAVARLRPMLLGTVASATTSQILTALLAAPDEESLCSLGRVPSDATTGRATHLPWFPAPWHALKAEPRPVHLFVPRGLPLPALWTFGKLTVEGVTSVE